MTTELTRRSVLGGLGAALAQGLFHTQVDAASSFTGPTGEPGKLYLMLTAVSQHVLRISIAPAVTASPEREPGVLDSPHEVLLDARQELVEIVHWGRYAIRVDKEPLRIAVIDEAQRVRQEIQFDMGSTAVRFRLGSL